MDTYEVVRAIGNGNYGTCFLVRNKSDGGQYAMKRIPIGKREESEAALQEAQVLKKLKHPNIISFKESFLHEGALCIVTSFCEEGDLFTRIRDNAKKQRFFPQEQIVEWFCQIALGLQYMHQHKILHRDLKTQNIFIARGGMIKLGDFGIAKVLEGTDDFATTVTGTPYYMAPEVCTNQPYTLKSDVWSLGCVLYEMCTLKHAFAADSLLGLVYQIVQGNCPPIPAERYDSQLSNLVAQMLARDSTKRPSTTQMLQEPWVKTTMEQMRTRGLRTLKAKPRGSVHKNSSVRGSALSTVRGTSAAFDGTSGKSMNPREQLAARKRAEADRRAAELKNATVHQVQEIGKAKDRKFKEFHCSKFGAPHLSEWQPGDTDAGVRSEQPGERLDNASMVEHLASLVNLGGTAADPSESQWLVSERPSGEGRLPGDGYRPTVTNEELPLPQFKPEIGPSQQDALGYGEGTTGFYTAGDTVMFGTANPTPPHGAALGTNPFPVQEAYVASPPPVAGMIPHDEKPVGTPSCFNDTGCSVLLGTAEGTMPAAHQMDMLAGTGGTVMLGATQDSMLAGTVQQQRLEARPATLAPDMTIGKAGSTALAPGSPSLLATARSQALALETSDDDDVMLGTMGTLQTFDRGEALEMGRRGETAREEEEDEEESYENDFEDYESDFEEYTPEDDAGPNTASGAADGRVGGDEQSEGVSTSRAVRREDMMSLRFCIESQLDGEPEEEVIDEVVEDCVPMSFRERQLEAHREKCRAALGPFYDEVLAHLRRVRRSGSTVDEQQLKHDLLDLVNGDKQKMQGCFEVDMLVYKEVML